ncbi:MULTISPECIES: glutarate dioxygenase GlaH [Paenibacillus]|uniref:Carbon starvation induced protein n=1 Tax=Paenibacillus naphthalenovorans TaxID=162209 RepID=A0A0U2VE57_9BACL|nr:MULTISPECIES: glutarate dioxygenase GlaH [Paenibacillus]ALS21795.1 carbon starvation induced protein [Paenibacillus naphthalenovorans]GCL71524.1 protein CsiD [Paenibacillus naphthalenovorans]SDI82420.1 protein CsiD [Paenibacillus naphthalenovorans]
MNPFGTLNYEIKPHPEHQRLKHVELSNASLQQFFQSVKDIDIERIEYVPFERFYLADQLKEAVGGSFQQTIRQILQDRSSGGFTIGVQEQTDDTDEYLKFATAIAYLIGISNHDAMSGKFYARFAVQHSDDSDTYLRQAFRVLELHTDGIFVDEPTDWLIMMKFVERNAVGGESRLLHLDDWEDLPAFSQHPLASHIYKYDYSDRGSKNVTSAVYNPTFYERNHTICMRYNHQCVHPQTIEQAMYLKHIQESMENSPGTLAVNLPVGQLVILNNHFWLHGREAFEKNTDLYRELMRQRGVFAQN